MRGKDEQQLDVFSYVSPEQRVPQDHPLPPLRAMTDEALREPRFHKLYAKTGRAVDCAGEVVTRRSCRKPCTRLKSVWVAEAIALMRKVQHRGIFKVGWIFLFAASAYNLVRLRNLAMQGT
jgi:hypothetical protein